MKHDAIVVGGGVHGLAAAALLARGGRGVLLLEARETLGGRAATAEFHPGFHAPGLDHTPARLARRALEALDLPAHGLETLEAPEPLFVPAARGPGLLVEHDPARARAELSVRDGAAYADWRAFLARVRPVISRALSAPAPDPFSAEPADLWSLLRSALDLRRLGREDMLELLRVLPMSAADWLNERFESPLLAAALAAPALRAGVNGPRAPHTAGLLLLRECAGELAVRGDTAALAAALERAARAAGCELRTGTRVTAIELDRAAGCARAVRTARGEELEAGTIVSAIDPRRTLLDLVGARALEPRVLDELEAFRCRGTTAVVRLALASPLTFRARPGVRFEHASFGGDLDDLERAFDPLKYAALPERPWLDVRVPTVSRPELAPAGHHLATIEVHAVGRPRPGPAAGAGGGDWDAEQRAALLENVLRRLGEVSELPASSILASELWTPGDVEREFGLSGGHLHHGEVAFDQLLFLRPGVSCPRHRTPVAGLWLAGPGTHPGGLSLLESALNCVAAL